MEVALYCPVYGFYEREEDTIGRSGDYFTSVSVGSLFGELLALQFASWHETARGLGAPLQLIEAGAHRGDLAADILRWLRLNRHASFERTQYFIIEPSPRRRAWQAATLAEFADKIRWVVDLSELANGPSPKKSRGEGAPSRDRAPYKIIFSNEFLDALPVHRFRWDASRSEWTEWGVDLEGERFVWAPMAKGSPASAGLISAITSGLPKPLLDVLPSGFAIDICPAASAWWSEAASFLKYGKLLTVDYGSLREESLMPENPHGTIRSYRKHILTNDPLADPGLQDITASVNFAQIKLAGEIAGLRTEGMMSQAQFLTKIVGISDSAVSGPWTPERTSQFRTLTHPEHLGEKFWVLIQGREQEK